MLKVFDTDPKFEEMKKDIKSIISGISTSIRAQELRRDAGVGFVRDLSAYKVFCLTFVYSTNASHLLAGCCVGWNGTVCTTNELTISVEVLKHALQPRI